MGRFLPTTALLGCLSASALFFVSGTSPGMARGHASELPEKQDGDVTLSPYFWVKSPDGSVEQMPLKATSVKASIAGVIADVKVTQVYRNEGKVPLEAVYVFPGSTRAAVYGMSMRIGERTIQAKIREKGQARQEYEAAKQQGKSASLLEQHRPNVFQMNVANIMPGDEIKVDLSYTELLVPTEGTYEFVYPTVVGPRYSNTPVAQATDAEKWVANPYTHQGVAPLSTFDLELRLAAGMPIARMACETHKNNLAYDGPGDALLRLDPSEKNGGNRDFILKYQLADKKIQQGLLLYRGKDENFFLLMVQPPKQVPSAAMPPREYVFIVDVSGSMSGYPLDTSKALMKKLVGDLRPQDRFNILVFESGSALWSESGSQPATPQNLQSALAFVGSKSGGGGTEIVSAMKRALQLPRAEGFSRTFVIATDGYISVEPQVFDVIRNNLGNANMFAFGIGTSVNRHLIEGMAHAGMGEPFVITRPEEAAPQAEKFRQYIASPVLAQVKVNFKGLQVYDVEPLKVPDVLAERPVLCFGKWKGEPCGSVEVTGFTGAGAYRHAFQVSESKPQPENAALRYLWARHRIQLLGDYGALGNGETQKAAITELGLKYGLLTNYTSFVAIDTQVRNEGGKTTQVTQPLPLPKGVSDAAVGGAMASLNCPSVAMTDDACKDEIQQKVMKVRPIRGGMEAAPALMPQANARRLKTDTSGLPLVTLQGEIEQKLKMPALAALLRSVPAGCELVFNVDEQGNVSSAQFTKAFPKATKALALVRQWHFANWSRKGSTTLRWTF